MNSVELRPVILCGGSGTRLWPMSRSHYPKQFIPLFGDHSLLQQTWLRLQELPVAAPIVVCNQEHRFLVAEQLRELGVKGASIVLEPEGRNTAPAIAVAALEALEQGSTLLLVLPADHVVKDREAFTSAVETAADHARDGRLLTFGVVPDRPETGYGYIKASADGVSQVAAFVEKPDLALAEEYVDSGRYLWNSGMFLFGASTYLKELGANRPDILNACRNAHQGSQRDLDFLRLDEAQFLACESDSIDYAVMEHTDNAMVVPLEAGWDDVGSWRALWEIGAKDDQGNVLDGDVVVESVKNSYIRAEQRLVAAVGVEDHIIVETADAVLVAHKNHAQEIKSIVARLNEEGRDEALLHKRVYRPWGSYEGIDQGERFQVKRITVNPGASLSLQMHHHRAEHWVVVTGTAKITRGEDEFILSENESVYIPIATKHRLENPGAIPLELIEVQSGSYLGEDDIVRFEDQYGR